MSSIELFLPDESASQALGHKLAQLISAPLVIFFHGALGAGKTTVIRSLLRELGIKGAIKSPSFSLMEPYDIDDKHILHIDLYRLVDPEELEYLALYDELPYSIVLIEWPEMAEVALPDPDLVVHLNAKDEGRDAQITAKTEKGKTLLRNFGKKKSLC